MSEAESIDQGWGALAEVKNPRASRWQVNTRGRKVVEMDDAELVASYKAGKLTSRSLVWSEGMRQWAPLGEVSRVSALLRADSQPPESHTRAIGDDTEPLAGTKTYRSAGSEPPTNPGTSPGTNPGTLAVYERPLATLVFPDSDEPPESSDEPTPAFGMHADEAAPATVPRIPPRDPLPGRTTLVDGIFEPAPALPPLPPRPQAFPAPVVASPLAAALSSTASTSSGDGYALAKATSLATKTPLPGAKPPAPVAKAPTPAVKAPPTPAPRIPTPLPALVTTTITAPATAASAYGAAPSAPTPPSAFVPSLASAAEKPIGFSPPRPAIEFLPPIIVQEKEDDGASLIELPPAAQAELDQLRAQAEAPTQPRASEMPLDVGFHESTLVLAGRRPKRWIPLGAAVAISVGAACLAAAFTAVIVRTRPAPPPRVVEKQVLVPAPAPTTEAPPPVTQPVAAAPEPTPVAPAPKAEKTEKSAELTATKPEPSATKDDSSKATWKREDPGELDDETPAPTAATPRQQRAGFPTNPGF